MDIIESLLLKRDCPRLNRDTFVEKSDPTGEYNCFAFAVGDTSQPWCPSNDDSYWPPEAEGVPQEDTTEAFIAAYHTKEYFVCDTDALEMGFDKIALYVDTATEKPTHAAHQLPNGKWESKLGGGIDIQHDSLDELTGQLYGKTVSFRFLKKRQIGVADSERQKASEGTRELSQQPHSPSLREDRGGDATGEAREEAGTSKEEAAEEVGAAVGAACLVPRS
jgi:hypothetical protein